jgi:ribosomal protein L7/L12
MRIRLYQAFASNNSGSYTLVGRFSDAATAAEVARVLADVSAEHHAWLETRGNRNDAELESPLDRFVARERLRAGKPGRNDDWPMTDTSTVDVVASGHQVLVHVHYTVTMPAVFGELMYARGGRVELELDHSHSPIACDFTYHVRHRDDAPDLDAFEAMLVATLPALCKRSARDTRPAIAPAFHRGPFDERTVSVVFADLVDGVRAVRALADEHGIQLWLRVYELHASGAEDPFALLRNKERPRGAWRVVLWSAGTDRIAAMRAVRELLGCGLTEARAALDQLPAELVVGVNEETARKDTEVLRAAGCEAEAILPTASDADRDD